MSTNCTICRSDRPVVCVAHRKNPNRGSDFLGRPGPGGRGKVSAAAASSEASARVLAVQLPINSLMRLAKVSRRRSLTSSMSWTWTISTITHPPFPVLRFGNSLLHAAADIAFDALDREIETVAQAIERIEQREADVARLRNFLDAIAADAPAL